MTKIFEITKCWLRKNSFYKKYCQTRVNNCRYWCRSIGYYYKLYHYRSDKKITGNVIYFIIDPNISHPGLVDRFKAMVGTYYIALQNGFEYKVIFTHPFNLNHYLDSTDKVNWVASTKDLSYSLKNSRIIPYNGGGEIPKLNKHVKQYHVYSYIGYDILETNKIENYKILWGELFKKLFKPTPLLQNALNAIPLKENEFIAVHLRFVNALESTEANQFNILSDKEKERLVRKCLDGIRNIISEYPDKKIAVFSDSNSFLNRAKNELPVIVLDGHVGHISFNSNEDVILKTFTDFYTISKAEKTIRILNKDMYVTAFSYYASLVGGKDFYDYKV